MCVRGVLHVCTAVSVHVQDFFYGYFLTCTFGLMHFLFLQARVHILYLPGANYVVSLGKKSTTSAVCFY